MTAIELLRQLRANYWACGKMVEAKAIETAIAKLKKAGVL